MKEKRQKGIRPAVIFGEKSVKRAGYIDDYIFACEIEGEDRIVYSKPRRPKYHLVIIVIKGYIKMVINGERYEYGEKSYINLPTWADIYETEYGNGFHAMITATDKSVIEDIFRNRNPFPMDFKLRIDHGLGGDIIEEDDLNILCKDIGNMIDALSDKRSHYFAEEINYAYFYILLTDMADMVWRRFGKAEPHHYSEMSRSDGLLNDFAKLLGDNILTETGIDFYAGKLCVSKKYLSFIVKDKMHVTIGTVISTLRSEVAAQMLRDPELSIQQVAEKMNFSDQSSFGKFFKKHIGVSPQRYRQTIRKTLLTHR